MRWLAWMLDHLRPCRKEVRDLLAAKASRDKHTDRVCDLAIRKAKWTRENLERRSVVLSVEEIDGALNRERRWP